VIELSGKSKGELVLECDELWSVGKETGQTNQIERFNNTLRQRISRLVRKFLSFSKNLENDIEAIWVFSHINFLKNWSTKHVLYSDSLTFS
jgi:hypothetical protein